ncbi:MAG: hypothetical protein M1812_006088 [Candelaria pacifica]|nr:MAG: hypothetical protein M1812_006088 [Candelaria pacifica]
MNLPYDLSILNLFALFTASSLAALVPLSETPQDAANERRIPKCDRDHLGSPSLPECNAAVHSFQSIISARGFALDQYIEFLEPGAAPLHADRYLRQRITELGDYHTFIGDANAQTTCVLRFFLGEPTQPTTSVSTYKDFLDDALTLLGACVAQGQGGWHSVNAQGRNIGVSMEEVSKYESPDTQQIAATTNYRVPICDRSLIPKQGGTSSSGVQPPVIGDPGQGSSTEGSGIQGPTYCNTQQSPSTCPSGQRCEGLPRVEDASDEQLRIYWGEALRRLLMMSGTCAGEFMV